MAKEFAVVGVSRVEGRWAVRYAQSLSRAKVLERNGHDWVKLFKMPAAGAKEDCVDFLLSKQWDIANSEANEAVLEEARRLGFLV